MTRLKLYRLLAVALIGLALCACVDKRTAAEVAANPQLAEMHRLADTIWKINDPAKASENSSPLSLQQKDEIVTSSFEQGYRAWKSSYAAKYMGTANVFYGNVGSLYSAIITYFEGSGRPGLAIPYLKLASEETLENLIIGGHLEYQAKLIDSYIRLGQYDLAEKGIIELEKTAKDLFACDIKQDPGQYDAQTVFFQATAHRVRLEFELDRKRQINITEWERRYEFLKASIEAFPEIRYFAPISSIDDFRYVTVAKDENSDSYLNRLEDALFVPYAKLFAEQGETEKALEALERAKDCYRLNVRRLTITDQIASQNYAVDSYKRTQLGFLKREYLELEKMEQRRRPFRSRSWLHSKDAEIRFTLGEYPKALESLQQAKVEFAKVEDLFDQLPTRYRQTHGIDYDALELKLLEAMTLEKLNRYREASSLYQEHVIFSEKVRQSLPVEERNHFFRSTARESYFGLLRCATAQYKSSPNDTSFSQVIAAAENFRSRQLREMLQSDDATDIQNINLTSLRTQLPQKSGALLIVDMVESCLVAFFDGKTHSAQLFAKDAAWDKNIFKLRNRLAENQQFDYAGLREISRQVFTGIEEQLGETDRLYVLSDGALSALPLEIFPIWSSSILADLTTVSYLPSLALLGQSSASNQNKQLFAVADPVYNAEETIDRHIGRGVMQATRGSSDLSMFQALPETRDEVQEILTGFTNKGSMLLGDKAKESTIKTMDLSPYSHVHFATHGVIGGEIPTLTEPALVLSYEDGEDGFLTASEVSKLNLNADMTVLSACNTGNGEYFRGEGLMGIGRAFMVAGSKQVVVSLWPVDSMATKELMVSFYQQMARGLDAPTALAAAKREYYMTKKQQIEVQSARGIGRKKVKTSGEIPKRFKQRGNPFFWSPFIVISAEG